MKTLDSLEQGRRQGVGAALLLLAGTEPARAYYILKQLGLTIAELQDVGFTEADVEPLKKGWREVHNRIAAASLQEPTIRRPASPRSPSSARH